MSDSEKCYLSSTVKCTNEATATPCTIVELDEFRVNMNEDRNIQEENSALETTRIFEESDESKSVVPNFTNVRSLTPVPQFKSNSFVEELDVVRLGKRKRNNTDRKETNTSTTKGTTMGRRKLFSDDEGKHSVNNLISELCPSSRNSKSMLELVQDTENKEYAKVRNSNPEKQSFSNDVSDYTEKELKSVLGCIVKTLKSVNVSYCSLSKLKLDNVESRKAEQAARTFFRYFEVKLSKKNLNFVVSQISKTSKDFSKVVRKTQVKRTHVFAKKREVMLKKKKDMSAKDKNDMMKKILKYHLNMMLIVWCPTELLSPDYVASMLGKYDHQIEIRNRYTSSCSSNQLLFHGCVAKFSNKTRAMKAAKELTFTSRYVRVYGVKEFIDHLMEEEFNHPKYGEGITQVHILAKQGFSERDEEIMKGALERFGKIVKVRFYSFVTKFSVICVVSYAYAAHAYAAKFLFDGMKFNAQIGVLAVEVMERHKERDIIKGAKNIMMNFLDESRFFCP